MNRRSGQTKFLQIKKLMKNKIKIIFSVLLFTILNFQRQNMKKEPVDLSQAAIKVDSCGLSYSVSFLKIQLKKHLIVF